MSSNPRSGWARSAWEQIPRPPAGWFSSRWARLPWPVRILVVVALFLFFALVVPSDPVARVMSPQSAWTSILFYPIGCYVLLAVGLNVVVGQAGMLDLGYVAFFAVGGYAMGLLSTEQHWNFWYILPAGIILSAAAGVILGVPVLRLRGDYLAIVTLGFGLIISIAANNWNWTGGPRGINGIPSPPNIGNVKAFNYGVGNDKPYYYLVLAAIFLVIFVVRRLERSRVGRAWAAIREDEDVAELMGVPTYRFRLLAFGFGAAVGGMVGVFYAAQQTHIDPTDFTYSLSVIIVAAVVLGGSGNLVGVILGAFVVAWLPERLRGFQDYRIMVFGGLLIIVMAIRPEGLIPSRRRRAEMKGHRDTGSLSGALVPGAETSERVEAEA